MTNPLFLFCGGPKIDVEGRPKPLMKVREGRSLIVHFLHYLEHHRPAIPVSITLLCDEGQEAAIEAELQDLVYPVPIRVQSCGPHASTFGKFEQALTNLKEGTTVVQFAYPDIFFFGEFVEPQARASESNSSVHISAAVLTSRFPRLVVDIYKNEVRGISDYSSILPANPLHVFGGDLWGRADELLALIEEFRSQVAIPNPSLEYDFFFWVINQKKMRCVMLHGERLWIDSPRDVQRLLAKTDDLL